MWRGRDSSRYCSEGSVGGEVGTAVGVDCCESSEISWISYIIEFGTVVAAVVNALK